MEAEGNPESSCADALLTALHECLHDLFIAPSCPICRREGQIHEPTQPCHLCCEALGLSAEGIRGLTPVRYRAAGLYRGKLRCLILRQRVQPNPSALKAITFALRRSLPANALLVPIPSWKRKRRANPLPDLVCQSLQRSRRGLLKRCRPTVGQHRLSRNQRRLNMRSCFAIHPEARLHSVIDSPIWIVDDILTTGATAQEAFDPLRREGLDVRGLLCLGRTL